MQLPYDQDQLYIVVNSDQSIIQKEGLIEFIISNMIYVGIASRRSILSLTFKAPQVSDQTMEFSMFISFSVQKYTTLLKVFN
jgi:hypothetical protein